MENIRNKCFYLNISHYYKEGDGYYPCNRSISNCEICSNKFTCDLCTKGFYFLENDRTQCYTDFDLSKYYSLDNGVSYFLCRNTLQNCEECLNDKICTKCLPDYFFKDYDKSRCYLEDDLYNNKSYYKYNDTTYMKCSNLI